ncbi:MAG: hypothetical protein WKF40_05185 [Thermoleophilaceae bacterium]
MAVARGRAPGLLAVFAVLAAAAVPGTALAEFPYPTQGDPTDFKQYRVGDETPNDLAGKLDWMYSATPRRPRRAPGPIRRGQQREPLRAGRRARGPSRGQGRRPADGVGDDHRTPRRGHFDPRLRRQVGRPRRHGRPAAKDADQQGRGPDAPPRPRHARSSAFRAA